MVVFLSVFSLACCEFDNQYITVNYLEKCISKMCRSLTYLLIWPNTQTVSE